MDDSALPRSWTFADQVSSYRFWGLVGAWVCVAFSMLTLRTSVLEGARQLMAYTEIAQLMGIGLPLGMVCGIVLGLLVVRGQAVRWLVALGVVGGILLPLILGWWAEPSLPVLALYLFLGQMLGFVFMLVVPAVLAGGRSGSVVFASVFAVALMLKAVVDALSPVLSIYLTQRWPDWSQQGLSVGAMTLAVALLLPLLGSTGSALFAVAPPRRHRPLEPRERSPLVVALWSGLLWLAALIQLWRLWLALTEGAGQVPAWNWLSCSLALAGLVGLVYWNYRIHGEVAALAPSPQLLTPRAAAWASVLMPLSVLLLPLQLAAVLNQTQKTRISTGWLVFWCLLLPPVALALVRRAVNQVAQGMGAATAATDSFGMPGGR